MSFYNDNIYLYTNLLQTAINLHHCASSTVTVVFIVGGIVGSGSTVANSYIVCRRCIPRQFLYLIKNSCLPQYGSRSKTHPRSQSNKNLLQSRPNLYNFILFSFHKFIQMDAYMKQLSLPLLYFKLPPPSLLLLMRVFSVLKRP